MTDLEWGECLNRLDEYERHIAGLEPDVPNPLALRCVHSRHRTLAHLRACQETWLEACIAFQERNRPSLKMLHPWRLFDQKGYENMSWSEHLTDYKADRLRLRELLKTADVERGGKINAVDHTIKGLVRRIVLHEHHHLFTPR